MPRLTTVRVPVRIRARLAASAMTGIGLLIALAATVGPFAPAGGEPGATLAVRLPDTIRATVLALLALSVIILIALQRPRRQKEAEDQPRPCREHQRLPAWAAVLLSLPVMLPLSAVAYLVWYRWSSGDGQPIGTVFMMMSALLELLAGSLKPSASSPLFDLAIGGLAVMAALAILALILLVALADRLERWWTGGVPEDVAPPLQGAVAKSLDDLRAEPDARAAIIRAYRRFEDALSSARAPRAPWQTPSEFMCAAIARLPVPRPPVERLTALFEVARFSNRHLGTEARDTACDCLDEIKAALERGVAHA